MLTLGLLAERIALLAAGAPVPGGGQPGPLEDGVGLVAQAPERPEEMRDLASCRWRSGRRCAI